MPDSAVFASDGTSDLLALLETRRSASSSRRPARTS